MMFWAWLIAAVPVIHLLAIAIPLSVIDIREHRLPNRLVLPAIATAVLAGVSASAISGQWQRLAWAFGIALAVSAAGLGLNRLGSLGMGDVKLLFALMHSLAWFAPWLALVALGLGFLSASLVSLVALARRRLSLRASIALGPYLLLGFGLASISALEQASRQLLATGAA